jgi:hypothetical protein
MQAAVCFFFSSFRPSSVFEVHKHVYSYYASSSSSRRAKDSCLLLHTAAGRRSKPLTRLKGFCVDFLHTAGSISEGQKSFRVIIFQKSAS